MKRFDPHTLSIDEARKEVQAFETLLASKSELSERYDLLPFFQTRRNLMCLLSTYVTDIANPDLVATEYDLFGDFKCDLAIGDSKKNVYLFVELEDAKANSIFVEKSGKDAPEWSPRAEHGFSQVIDWFWKLNGMERTIDYESRFGAPTASMHGLVIVGRDQHLETREKHRLRWRQEHTVIASKRPSVLTFDQLLDDLKRRLALFPAAALTEKT